MLQQAVADKFKNLSLEAQELFINRLEELCLSPLEIPVLPIKAKTPHLSHAQERLWFLYELESRSSNYNLNRCIRLKGPLSRQALYKSIQLVVQRHDALRTAISTVNKGPFCMVVDTLEVPLEIYSVKDKSQKEVATILAEQSSKAFNLQTPPLLRTQLFETNRQDEYLFLLTIHHIISDGVSLETLFKEISILYNAIRQNQDICLPTPSLSYSDYVFWQRKWFQDRQLKSSLNFWKDVLRDAPNQTFFPPDLSLEKKLPKQGSQFEFDYGHSFYESLIVFCKEHRTTLFNFFLTCFNILLYRYTGQSDLIIGTPSAGRLRPELSDLIGLFANTVIMRNTISVSDSFLDCLKSVSQRSIEAFDHQLVPFEKIVREINVDRDPNYTPFFQILFIFHKARQEDLKLEGLEWEVIPVRQLSSKFTMTIEIIELEANFKLNIEYDTSLYKQSTIERIAQHFENLVRSALNVPNSKIGELTLLSESEKKRLIQWNNHQIDVPAKTIHELISNNLSNHLSSIAIEFEDKSITYADLEEQTNSVARFLVQKGLSVGDRVGVFMLPGISLVPCLLGILKAGCAYVPLDPSYPLKRLAFIVEEADLKLIIKNSDSTTDGFLSKVKAVDFRAAVTYKHVIPLPSVKPSEIAYIMYTSGSTGQPKGIMVEHRNVINTLIAFEQILEIKSEDRWLSTTTFAFDISVLEFFLPLIVGATLKIVERTKTSNMEELIKEIQQFKPTIIQGTPSFWILLFMKEWKPDVKFTILCGGEQLSLSLAKQLCQFGKKAFNVYGPTETTIWSTVHQLTQQDEDIFIGKPIANTQIFILDESKAQVPINVVGDLYIGGKGVSRGYLNRPNLMEERFITLPHLSGHELVYATHDKAKFTETGAIKFIGRADYQVKVRGFRVEIQEIETLLQRHETVQRAVVYTKTDSFGQNYLVALIQPSKACLISDLLIYLKDQLPAYMLPSQWKIVDRLPILPNGKIDQAALQAIHFDYNLEHKNDEVLTVYQERVAEVWKKNLERQEIGLHDNYFDLGGHSLLAVQLVDEINQEFNSTISLKILFRHPTVAKMAEYIEKNAQMGTFIPPIRNGLTLNSQDAYLPFRLTDVQRAYWVGRTSIFDVSNLSSHLYREIEIKNLDTVKLEKALNYLVQRHAALRTIILNDAQQQVLEQVPWYQIQIHDARHSEQSQGEKVREAIREEMSHQVLIENQWPLFDIEVTSLATFDCLHVSINLLIADAFSLEILFHELSTLYDHPQLNLPPLSLTFRDYVEHLNESQQSLAYEQSKQYWLNRMDDFSSGPQLPIECPLASLNSPRIKRYSKCLDKESWQKIKALGKKEGMTPNIVLLTAFSVVLRKWTQDPRFSIVLTLFNRPPLHPEINSIVGDFTTVSIIDIPFHSDRSFIESATACQERLFEDLDHRHFSGVQVTQELLKKGKITEPIAVVFTSLIGLEQLGVTSSFTKDIDSTQTFSVTQTPQIILDHQVIEYEGNLYLNWDVVEEVFPKHLISVMFETYFSFLSKLALSPNLWQGSSLSFSDVSHPPDFEKMLMQREQKTLWEVNKAKLLHEGILNQAQVRPDAIAVAQGNEQITYRNLVLESQRVHRALKQLGVQQRSLIGVVMDKTWQQVSTAIGILMHGCAYVPIDLNLPLERIKETIKESGCVLIFVNKYLENLSEIQQIIYQELPTEFDSLSQNLDIQPSSLAYVIYTSGSSGKPKGVMIEHQAAMNTIHAVNERLSINCQDSIYGISSLSFDLSVYDVFGILSVGGKLVLPEPKTVKDPEQWLADIRQHRISIWNSVPFFMSMMIEYIRNDENKITIFQTLKTILMSGDWIPISLPPAIEAIHPQVRVFSLGGATEAAIWSIWYEIPKNMCFKRSIPYGKSMDNQYVLVLGPQLEEKPIYAEGEIFIGGRGVAQGYWNNQEKTELQFLSHPQFGRLFRTFDKGRYLADGTIEFLGRADRQVKVKGFRIELAEIESKINQSSRVQQSAVILFDKGEQQKEIHAFAVLANDQAHLEQQAKGASLLSVKLKQSQLRKDLEAEAYEKVSLLDNLPLHKIISHRRSHRTFADGPITFTDFSVLLACLKQMKLENYPLIKAFYGSASSLYPVQVYIHLKEDKIVGINRGNYYYHPQQHQLIKLNEHEIPTAHFAPNNHELVNNAAFYIFLVANLSIIEPIYHTQAKLYCSLEAGMMAQLLEMRSVDTSIGLCQVGNTSFEAMSSLFSLPSSSHYIHGLVGGYVNQEIKDASLPIQQASYLSSPEEEILANLKQKLPQYMIPSSVTILPQLPTTNNGKIDQQALVRIIQAKAIQKVPEKLNTERIYAQLTAIWQETLNISHVPNNQVSFFDLGGDSIKLIQLHKKLESMLGIQIAIGDLFRFSTIEDQINYLRKTTHKSEVLQQSKHRAQLRNQSRKSGDL